MYRVFLERAAEKDLKRLSSKVHDRVIIAIRGLASDPRPHGCRKLAGSKHDWRIRVGDLDSVRSDLGSVCDDLNPIHDDLASVRPRLDSIPG